MRVCILAQASPCTWVTHYVAAFRQCCDTLVVGPHPSEATLKDWDRTKAAHLLQPNDVACDFEMQELDLHTLLPPGWEPDLVVGIAGIGGDRLYQGVARLPWPTAFLSTDTWQCLFDYREALGYDFVFAAQKEFVQHLHNTGSPHVFWLPLACSPQAHHPLDDAPTHDIAFAGSANLPIHRERPRLLQSLARHFSVLAQEAAFGDALCHVFARGRLAFNHSAVQELNMRIFETLGMGRALLTNRQAAFNGLLELFEDGKHLIAYDSEEDLIAKAADYLADAERRNAIALAGRAEVLARHTYAHRVQTILDLVHDYAPPPDPQRATTAYQGEHLRDYLPTVPGVVVDYGLELGASKVALRRRGVTRLIGVAATKPPGPRRRSYDQILPLTDTPRGEADTVVVGKPSALPVTLDEVVRRAYALLRVGGTLVLRLRDADHARLGPNPDPARLTPWLESHDFHLRLCVTGLGQHGCILLARKRRRRLAAIVEEVFTRLQVPEMDIPELLRRIPPGW